VAGDDDDKLDSFKIGDLQRPEVRGSATARSGSVEEAPEAPSAGFPAIEGRLENASVDQVADELRPTYEALEALADSGSKQEKAAAKKAMAAYERTADLFEYLYMTRDALAAPPEE
jgi:hypothetical protein